MAHLPPIIHRLLGDSLLISAQKNPSKVVVTTNDVAYTYQELLNYSAALANALQQRGLQRGGRVAIYMDNSWPALFSLYGVLLAGGVFVMINPQTKADKLAYILNDSDAHCLLTDIQLENNFYPVLDKLQQLRHVIYAGKEKEFLVSETLIEHFDKVLDKVSPDVFIKNRSVANDLAALIYTSGSTGSPKGVMHTHLSMLFALNSLIEYLRLSDEERILNVLPLSFDYGLYQLLMTVHLGATLILEKSFAFPALMFKRILEKKVTVFPGVPSLFAMLLSFHERSKQCFPSVTRITNTAAALPADFIPTLKEIFPNALIYKMYGLTECKRVSYLEPELVDIKPTSVGEAIPGTEVFLLSPEGKPVTSGDVGILYVRGPHVMLGYWKQKELSEHMLKDDVYPNQKILCTHDWFKMDNDGLLYFVGRSDDIIKTRGEKVSPIEVEHVIYGIEGVNEVAVIGVPDAIFGQFIKAFVSLKAKSSLDDKKIKKICVAKLENYMVPKEVIVMNSLPKTANGKIDKKQLS